MFELPELATIAAEMPATVEGKRVLDARLGNVAHKFVWYNRTHDEFSTLVRGKRIGAAHAEGKWLFVPLEPGYVLLLGEWGGRIAYDPAPAVPPKKYHLYLGLEDGSAFWATTQMWGGVGLFEQGQEREYAYVRDMRTQPTDPAFTLDYFRSLAEQARSEGKRSVKGLLTQEGFVPGLGNAIAQDIMFRARLHPKRDLADLTDTEMRALYDETVATVRDVIEAGGRYDERDLLGNAGGYVRLMGAKAVGTPCPQCGTPIEKLQYLGGACYVCPQCQVQV